MIAANFRCLYCFRENCKMLNSLKFSLKHLIISLYIYTNIKWIYIYIYQLYVYILCIYHIYIYIEIYTYIYLYDQSVDKSCFTLWESINTAQIKLRFWGSICIWRPIIYIYIIYNMILYIYNIYIRSYIYIYIYMM